MEAARAGNCTDLEVHDARHVRAHCTLGMLGGLCRPSTHLCFQERCPEWAGRGECGLNPTFMLRTCKLSCNLCKVRSATSGCLPPNSGCMRVSTRNAAAQGQEFAEVIVNCNDLICNPLYTGC